MEHLRDVVELRIPRKPEYVSVARLAVSGIAGRMEFSYDEVEDIKLAVGEACANAIQEMLHSPGAEPIVVRCQCETSVLRIEVIRPGDGRAPSVDDEPISKMLMEVLMDEVEVNEDSQGGMHVTMTKYVSRDEE